MYVVEPMNRMTAVNVSNSTKEGRVKVNAQARPATEYNKNVMYPDTVASAPESSALPFVDLQDKI